MLEECGLPYVVHPIDISRGEQFAPNFLAISPNNRIPAIVDPAGPAGGRSRSSSWRILQYLGRKTGKFYPREERARVAVEEWLFWQMGGLGPMAGQANHFRRYAPEKIEYGIDRYTNEVNRLFGVMNTRLGRHEFLAGRYSIADMACVGWVRLAERMGQDVALFPHRALVRSDPRKAGSQACIRDPGRGSRCRRHARSESARDLVRAARALSRIDLPDRHASRGRKTCGAEFVAAAGLSPPTAPLPSLAPREVRDTQRDGFRDLRCGPQLRGSRCVEREAAGEVEAR